MNGQPRRLVDTIVIHGAWTRPDHDPPAAEIRAWHLARVPAFDDIGYHFVWRRNGDEEIGRPLPIAGAHCLGANATSIAIVMNGGRPRAGDGWAFNYTREQLARLARLPDQIERWRASPALAAKIAFADEIAIIGHCDGDARRPCPGFDVKAFFQNLERRAA